MVLLCPLLPLPLAAPSPAKNRNFFPPGSIPDCAGSRSPSATTMLSLVGASNDLGGSMSNDNLAFGISTETIGDPVWDRSCVGGWCGMGRALLEAGEAGTGRAEARRIF